MDAESQLMAYKDAEIAQLTDDIRQKDALIDAFELELAQALNKDAEIESLKQQRDFATDEMERLQASAKRWSALVDKYTLREGNLKRIITELTDALSVHSTTYPGSPIKDLIREAREATNE
jgi:chromosome segregation ATPase